MELHRPNTVALGFPANHGGNDSSYGGSMMTEVPQKHELLGRGLRKIQSQRSFCQGQKQSSFSGVVDKSGSDPRKLMLSSLGTSFRRSTKPSSIQPMEDITETARSTKHSDYDGTSTHEGKRCGALIEEVSLVLSVEDRRSRFSKKVGSSLRMLQGVSFRRTKSSMNLMDEPCSANIEEPVDISAEELHISIGSIGEDGGTDTLDRLGWSLRRSNASSEIATDEREKSRETDFLTSEAIQESSESSMEDFISPNVEEEAIKELPSKDHGRLHVDMVGEIEFGKSPKSNAACTRDKLADIDAIKIQPEIVKFCRKPSPLTSSGCNPLPVQSEDRRVKLPEETLEDVVAPMTGLEPFWPTADGVNPFEKVANQAKEESSSCKKLSRRKLKRSGSAESSIGHSFRKMLSFRATDSKHISSSGENQHERRGIFRFGSRRSAWKSFRLLSGRSKSSISTVAVNNTGNTGTQVEQPKENEPAKPGVCKSEKPAGQNALTPVDQYPSKQEERKTVLARIRTKVPLKDDKREAVKKSKSLQLEHEGMMSKGLHIQERKALMYRLVRRAASFPIPRRTDDKTIAEDESVELSHHGGSKQDTPKVVVGQDSVSTISSLGFPEVNTTPVVVECKEGSSAVSTLGRSERSSIKVNEGDKVPSIIAVETDDFQASSLYFSFSGSKV